MNGWILYQRKRSDLLEKDYEIKRLLEESPALGIELEVFSASQFDMLVSKEGSKSLLIDGKKITLPDFILPRTGDSSTYYDLSVLRHMERIGVPIFNTAATIENVKDKLRTQQILSVANIPAPKTLLAKHPLNIDYVEQQIRFPLVLKSLSGSLGHSVILVNDRPQLEDFVAFINCLDSKNPFILQEFIGPSMEEIFDIRVFVVGHRVVGCMKRTSVDGSFKTNISRGAKGEKIEPTPEMEWISIETSVVLDLDVTGVDLLFDGISYKVCECNSSPQFQGLEKNCEVNVAKSILEYIKMRLM